MEQQSLFANEIPKNVEPIQDVDITTFILYLSTTELREFKKLAKEGIKKLYGEDFQAKGNVTDYIMYLVRKYNKVDESDLLIQSIYQATGLKLGNYGFICGTYSPYGTTNSMQGANMKSGYIIWKRVGTSYKQKDVTPEEHSFETIINFLNEK